MNDRPSQRPEISAETRLNLVLDAIPGALDYIVSLKPHDFQRLHNSFMRKYMSPRITLGRVSAIARISPELLVRNLIHLRDGEPVEPASPSAPQTDSTLPQSPATPPDWWRAINPVALHWIDLLPIDEVLGDPFPPISVAVKQLPPGGVLGIRHRWEPQPLYDIWQKMHIQWFARQVGPDEWHIFVHKPRTNLPSMIPLSVTVELRHLPEIEVAPRVITMCEQLQPSQRLDITGMTVEAEAGVRQALAARYGEAAIVQKDSQSPSVLHVTFAPQAGAND